MYIGLSSRKNFLSAFITVTLLTSISSFGSEPSALEGVKRNVIQVEKAFSAIGKKKCPLSLPLLIEVDQLKPPLSLKKVTVVQSFSLRDEGMKILSDLWKLRMKARQKFQLLSQKDAIDESCARDFQQTFEYLRRSEETLMMWLIENDSLERKLTNVFMAPFPYNLENAQFDKSFQVGDIFLIRGDSWISSFIGGMGGVGTSFTHAAIIADDGGTKVVLETAFPSGTEATKLKVWLQERQARIIHYRFNDPTVSAQAAQAILKKIQLYSKEHKSNIPYNFSFAPTDPVSWYCAEMISWAFSFVTEGKVQIPKYVASIAHLQKNKLFNDFEVKAKKVFLPTDIEIDPRFNLVQEFRYVGSLSSIQKHDAIMQILLGKISSNSEKDQVSLKIRAEAWLLKLKSLLLYDKEDLSFYISARALQAGIQMKEEVESLDKKIQKELILSRKDVYSYEQIIHFLKTKEQL